MTNSQRIPNDGMPNPTRSSRGELGLLEFGHSLVIGNWSLEIVKPLAGLFHRLTPSPFQALLRQRERGGPLDLLRVQGFKMAECRGLAPLARRHALFSKQARLARPVDIPKLACRAEARSEGWSAWGDLHSQGCSGLSRTGLLFPVNHTPVRRAVAR